MQLQLVAGDYVWDEQGRHVWDESGFSTVLGEPKTVEMSEDVYAVTIPFVEAYRVYRGLNPDGTVPAPEPEPVPEPTPEPVPEPTPEPEPVPEPVPEPTPEPAPE